ncbi:MAG: 50S ribosomal protein L7/L12 [Armatimonadota bacterium]|nr:50S ribosomal protein L7/L12 [Armatimonadota bacterium]
MASEKVTQALELVGGMTVLELNELVKTLQDEWGVTAAIAAPVAAAGAPAAGADGAAPAAEEEPTEFQVVLKDAGAQKIQVIKAVREVVANLGLKEAKDLVEGAPTNVGNPVNKEEAQKIREKLEAAGAGVDVKPA